MKVSPAKATVDRPVPNILNVSPLTKLPVPVSPAVFIVVAGSAAAFINAPLSAPGTSRFPASCEITFILPFKRPDAGVFVNGYPPAVNGEIVAN